jgi:uncharacterized PurR-regulated membrane protein YhhQ (DUF165 family)
MGNWPGRQMKNYKFLNHIVLCNVFFAIICIPTAGKLIDVAGVPLSISIYYFPFVYIFADILTEVYGYTVARRMLWYCTVIFQFVISYPPSAVMTNNQSYVDVLSTAPRLVLIWNTCDVCGRHRQQLCSGKNESVD